MLEPGESRTVELTLDRRAFADYDVELSRWVVAPGDYTIHIGHSAAEIVAAQTITLSGEVINWTLSLDSTVGEWFSHPLVDPAIAERIGAGMTEEQAEQAQEPWTGSIRIADQPAAIRMIALNLSPSCQPALAQPKWTAWMVRHTSGLLCTPMPTERAWNWISIP